jgi:hypothetical protein
MRTAYPNPPLLPPTSWNSLSLTRRSRLLALLGASDRAVRWLGRKGYIDQRAAEDRSNETPEPSAIEACTQLALAGGAFLARP